MTEGAFRTSYDSCKQLLNQINLAKSSGIKVIYKDGVSNEFMKASQQSDYFKLYNTGIENLDYDILMYDDSFFQFSYEGTDTFGIPVVRFAFFQNPKLYISYLDYLKLLQEQNLIDENEDLEKLGVVYYEEYSQFLNEQQVNTSNTSIRFDVDSVSHYPLIHSTCHFHFGHVTNVRVPCKKIISPIGFVLFVLKHIYYSDWKILIENKEDTLITALDSQKGSFIEISYLNDQKWIMKEELELYIN